MTHHFDGVALSELYYNNTGSHQTCTKEAFELLKMFDFQYGEEAFWFCMADLAGAGSGEGGIWEFTIGEAVLEVETTESCFMTEPVLQTESGTVLSQNTWMG